MARPRRRTGHARLTQTQDPKNLRLTAPSMDLTAPSIRLTAPSIYSPNSAQYGPNGVSLKSGPDRTDGPELSKILT